MEYDFRVIIVLPTAMVEEGQGEPRRLGYSEVRGLPRSVLGGTGHSAEFRLSRARKYKEESLPQSPQDFSPRFAAAPLFETPCCKPNPETNQISMKTSRSLSTACPSVWFGSLDTERLSRGTSASGSTRQRAYYEALTRSRLGATRALKYHLQ